MNSGHCSAPTCSPSSIFRWSRPPSLLLMVTKGRGRTGKPPRTGGRSRPPFPIRTMVARALARSQRHYFRDKAPKRPARSWPRRLSRAISACVCLRQAESAAARSLPFSPSFVAPRPPLPLSSSAFRSRAGAGGVSPPPSPPPPTTTNGAISESIVSGARYIWMRAREREEEGSGWRRPWLPWLGPHKGSGADCKRRRDRRGGQTRQRYVERR